MTGTQETSYQAPAKLKGKYASSDIFVFTSIIQSKGPAMQQQQQQGQCLCLAMHYKYLTIHPSVTLTWNSRSVARWNRYTNIMDQGMKYLKTFSNNGSILGNSINLHFQ